MSGDAIERDAPEIDWGEPIEFEDGRRAYVTEFDLVLDDSTRGVGISDDPSDASFWNYRRDGTHFYSDQPAVRNVRQSQPEAKSTPAPAPAKSPDSDHPLFGMI